MGVLPIIAMPRILAGAYRIMRDLTGVYPRYRGATDTCRERVWRRRYLSSFECEA